MASTPSPYRRSYAAVAAANIAPRSPTSPTRIPIVSLTYDDHLNSTVSTTKRSIATPIRYCSAKSPPQQRRRPNPYIASVDMLATAIVSTLDSVEVECDVDNTVIPTAKSNTCTAKKKTKPKKSSEEKTNNCKKTTSSSSALSKNVTTIVVNEIHTWARPHTFPGSKAALSNIIYSEKEISNDITSFQTELLHHF